MPITLYSSHDAIQKINQLSQAGTPFLFIINYDCTQSAVTPLSEINPQEIAYDFPHHSNLPAFEAEHPSLLATLQTPIWHVTPVTKADYLKAFTPLMSALQQGSIQLANLTFPSQIRCNLTFPEIFHRTNAKYRLYFKDHCLSFSPETFVTIDENGIIKTNPMKGTINAQLPDAEKQIMENPKEIDEHQIVAKEGLADIALVAENATITRYRYIDRISRGNGEILQTSTEIQGQLPSHYRENLGDILFRLLPAGSITGAPRAKATALLSEIEEYDRGFYTGIAGIFDGKALDSTVLIRYLEPQSQAMTTKPEAQHSDNALFHYTFKSGGGITALSDATSEYDELIEKIYLPIY